MRCAYTKPMCGTVVAFTTHKKGGGGGTDVCGPLSLLPIRRGELACIALSYWPELIWRNQGYL